MFLNISNHPSDRWQKKQYDAACEYGEVVDLPFPLIPGQTSEKEIWEIASEYLKKVDALRPDVVFLAGEFTFVYMMVDELLERGIRVVAPATERIAEEKRMEDGSFQKTTGFDFVRFRDYTKFRTPMLGISKNGIIVRDRKTSHLHDQCGNLKELLAEAIRRIDIDWGTEDKVRVTWDFGFEIGTSSCVPEEQYKGEVVKVYRKNRKGKTPMVKDTPPIASSKLSFVLLQTGEKEAVCVTAYIGELVPREPWDPHIETREELEYATRFWNTHALVYDETQIDWDSMVRNGSE